MGSFLGPRGLGFDTHLPVIPVAVRVPAAPLVDVTNQKFCGPQPRSEDDPSAAVSSGHFCLSQSRDPPCHSRNHSDTVRLPTVCFLKGRLQVPKIEPSVSSLYSANVH